MTEQAPDSGEQLQPTSDARQRILAWEYARMAYSRLAQELDKAGQDLTLRAQALGQYMAPADASVGETFCMWVGDGLLKITVERLRGSVKVYEVSWRTRPSEKSMHG